MNILFIYPKMPFAFWSMSQLLKMAGKQANDPPVVGLLTVAAMLPSEWNKRLVDLNLGPLGEHGPDPRLGRLCLHRGHERPGRLGPEVIASCRRAGVKVVAGEPLFTHEHQNFPGVDHFVLNEAEVTLPPFVADLEAGCPKPLYTSSELADVHQTPVPLWAALRSRPLRFRHRPVFPRLPVYVRFLLCHRPLRPPPAGQDRRADDREALEALGDLDRFDLVVFADDNHRQQETAQVGICSPRSSSGADESTPPSVSRPRSRSTWPTTASSWTSCARPVSRTSSSASRPGRGRPPGLQEEPEHAPQHARQRARAAPGRLPGHGWLHRRIRHRHPDHLRPPDRVHPGQRDRHRRGQRAQGPPGTGASTSA